jgi:hypothetical protein
MDLIVEFGGAHPRLMLDMVSAGIYLSADLDKSAA